MWKRRGGGSARDLIAWLEQQTIDDLIRMGLHEGLTRVVNEIQRIGDVIHRIYFEAGAQVPQLKKPAMQMQSNSQM